MEEYTKRMVENQNYRSILLYMRRSIQRWCILTMHVIINDFFVISSKQIIDADLIKLAFPII